MSAAESLVVKLDADVGKYVRNIKRAEAANDKMGRSSKNAGDKAKVAAAGMARVAATAATVATGVGVAAVAVGALGAAIGAMVDRAADSSRELENLRRSSKLTAEEFKAVTIATTALGVSAEGFADISKDINDRLGEFAKVGTGPFQDFADVANLTKEEAKALAVELQDLSSPMVIGQLVMMMEQAGATSNEMTFALESLGNDLSKLIPLFEDGSSKLETMTQRFRDVLEPIALTREETAALAEAGIAFDLLSQSMSDAGDKIAAQFAPAMTDIVNFISEKVPVATEAITDLLNVVGLGDELSVSASVETPEEAATEDAEEGPKGLTPEEKAERQAEIYDLHLNHNQAILESDYAYYEATLEAMKQMRDEGVITEENYTAEVKRLTQERAKAYREEAQEAAKQEAAKANNFEHGVQIASVLGNAMFEDNKLVKAGLVVADTASAIMRSLSINPYDYSNVAVLAATGAVQLANVLSASKGGGGSTSGAAGGGTSVQNRPEDFAPETTDLTIESDIEGAGTSVNRVSLSVEDSDDFIEELADRINRKRG